MSRKPDLYNRFLNFLMAVSKKNSEMWVRRNTLKDYAFNAGYKSQTVWDAIEELDNAVNIGKIFDGGAKYRYCKMSEKDIKILENEIKRFDKLP